MRGSGSRNKPPAPLAPTPVHVSSVVSRSGAGGPPGMAVKSDICLTCLTCLTYFGINRKRRRERRGSTREGLIPAISPLR